MLSEAKHLPPLGETLRRFAAQSDKIKRIQKPRCRDRGLALSVVEGSGVREVCYQIVRVLGRVYERRLPKSRLPSGVLREELGSLTYPRYRSTVEIKSVISIAAVFRASATPVVALNRLAQVTRILFDLCEFLTIVWFLLIPYVFGTCVYQFSKCLKMILGSSFKRISTLV